MDPSISSLPTLLMFFFFCFSHSLKSRNALLPANQNFPRSWLPLTKNQGSVACQDLFGSMSTVSLTSKQVCPMVSSSGWDLPYLHCSLFHKKKRNLISRTTDKDQIVWVIRGRKERLISGKPQGSLMRSEQWYLNAFSLREGSSGRPLTGCCSFSMPWSCWAVSFGGGGGILFVLPFKLGMLAFVT